MKKEEEEEEEEEEETEKDRKRWRGRKRRQEEQGLPVSSRHWMNRRMARLAQHPRKQDEWNK